MKEAYFFSHDYNARQDPKMQEVLMDLGVAGLGIYWCIIEQLYEQGGRLPLSSIKAIAFTLHANIDDVRRLVEDYGLFENDKEEFWSPRVARNIECRKKLTEKRSEAAAGRWTKRVKNNISDANASEINANASEINANAMQKSEIEEFCNAIKVNEIKINNNKKDTKVSLCNAHTCACATEEERERFLEIFTFVLNFVNPQQEVERFVAHYDATEWCRKDSTVPVKNKEALARMWKPQTAGERFPEEVRQWLFETYGKAKASDPVAAAMLLRGIDRAVMTARGEERQVRLDCSQGAMSAIEKYFSYRPTFKLMYKIPN